MLITTVFPSSTLKKIYRHIFSLALAKEKALRYDRTEETGKL